LADGSVLTSALNVPFAFSGMGGNSRSLTPPQYKDFEPRFGFAWQPKLLQDRRMVLRGGWGMSHGPIGGFTQLPQPDFGASTSYASGVSATNANPNTLMRIGENPPVLTPETVNQQIFGLQGPPANGLSYANGLYYQATIGGYAVSQNYHTPYVNNWNLTLSWQATHSTTIEFTYTGSMGIHLFMPQEDLNPKNSSVLSAELANNISSTGTIADPLGRTNPLTGKTITIQNGTLGGPYLGFSTLNLWYDASGNSIRHAGYVNVMHRAARGLTFTANYTYGKSIDTASSAGGDKNYLSPVNGQVGGQVAYGGTRQNDRSVSTYDQRHVIHGNAIYDLPFGKGREFGNHLWKPLDWVVGGWTTTGLFRWNTGFPYIEFLTDSNQLGDLNHSARPNLITGVPLVNPLFNLNCPTGTNCQPYLNPAAFMRPPLGQLGDAPRTLDGARGPAQRFFDLSVQKSFRIGESGKRRLQFRVDALNVFNHPTFGPIASNSGGSDFGGAPSTAALSTAQYNAWATANSQPLAQTANDQGNMQLTAINNMVNSQKNASNVLPANFFTIPLPANFFGTQANSFNITTLQGYKLYQLRTAYNAGFGDLTNTSSPRYIQFGAKLYF
jgi:hypothetical protein